MTTGFQQQQVSFSFPKAAPIPQQVGSKIKPPRDVRAPPVEKRSFSPR